MIKAIDISKSIAGKLIFDNINIELSPGQVVGIWGPNGCGKSTLLKVLGGICHYGDDSGPISYANDLILGYMPQNPVKALLPWFSAWRNLKILSKNKFNSAEAKNHLISQFGFSEVDVKKTPLQLSGGFCKRLLFACLLTIDCNCFLLDEPFAAMDWNSLKWAIAEIRSLAENKKCIVIVTHEPEHVILSSDQVIALKPNMDGVTVLKKIINIVLSDRTISALHSEAVLNYVKELMIEA